MADTDDISGLLGLLSGSSQDAGDQDGNGSSDSDGGIFGDIDPETLIKLIDIISKLGETDKNTALLAALRPHLREENRAKLDRAAKIMKLMSIIPLLRDSGIDLF